ncbi:hypothetical protein [Pseudoglutamicibacter albus]|uniref:DUF5642 domain-containing protein n=1 Tax=Pseudoglutamicibacter albus TaxID=98671 RepID=A0ABU1Z1L6_9MICC|nr:hypothetical protein [Pseudoglutamicibacter albus]MDR7294513.1 hypothetical protein [Pseudoglutamicibacter albus]
MLNKTKTARRTLAILAVPSLLAAALVGCSSNDGGDKKPAEETTQAAPQNSETPTPTESAAPSSSESSEKTPDGIADVQDADRDFVQLVKKNVGKDYQVADLKPYLQKPDLGNSKAVKECPVSAFGAAELVEDGSQIVTALKQQSSSKSGVAMQGINVIKYTSGDQAENVLERVRKENENSVCSKIEIQGQTVTIKPIKDKFGFDETAGFATNLAGTNVEYVYAVKGDYVVSIVGDAKKAAADAKKVYDALP